MTTAMIAQVAQRGKPGLSPSLWGPKFLFVRLVVFLPDFFDVRAPNLFLDFLREVVGRFGAAGFGGGGGSFVTDLMIRPPCQTKHKWG